MQFCKFAIFIPNVAAVPLRQRRCITCLLVVFLLAACSAADNPKDANNQLAAESPPAAFLGSDACSSCHQIEFTLWAQSHHAQAMLPATPDSIRGDFSDVEFRHFNTTSTFFARGDEYLVRTENASGEQEEFSVAYTFGVEPLQQYLVAFPNGRMQVLPAAWDTRAANEGGQRWIHLYPGEPIESGDALHWTGREQNWNFMCAECHSTNLNKNYSVANDEYATSWSEISVGCEACHGPGSVHVAQATSGEFSSYFGLEVSLDDMGRAVWEMNAETGIAARSESRMRPPAQPEACGRCHSRRAMTSVEYTYGLPLLDTHTPVLLDDGLYFADGQVRDEVYVYGSFLQSRMYEAGVTCGDCHDAHSGRLRTGPEPNAVCATCHLPERFASIEHHFHETDSVGCVDCHMPSRDYMVIDGRRDHSFRIPRPDLTEATGVPNACTGCHEDQDAQWAQTAVLEWYGVTERSHYAFALHAARSSLPGANNQLAAAIGNRAYPGIARATALTELRPPYSQDIASDIRSSLSDGDPLIRVGALRALSGLPSEQQIAWGGVLLSDAIRSVRVEAARVISPLRTLLPVHLERAFTDAERELITALKTSAERPEAAANLGGVYAEAGDMTGSEREFLRALRYAPQLSIARVNLADVYRRAGREADAEALLRDGLALTPNVAALHHSLGLLLVRGGRADEGLTELRNATELDAGSSRYVYVYAVALNSLGQAGVAIELLSSVKNRFAADFDIHWALATMLRDQGDRIAAKEAALELAQRVPGIPRVAALLESLQ